MAIRSILSAKPLAIPTTWKGVEVLIRRQISLQDVVILALVWTKRIRAEETTEVM